MDYHINLVNNNLDTIDYYYKIFDTLPSFDKDYQNIMNLIQIKTNLNFCEKCKLSKYMDNYFITCKQCGEFETYNVSDIILKKYKPYKKINHLIKKIDELKLDINIDENIFNKLKQLKINSPEQLKKHFKKMNLKKYYKYCIPIFIKLNNKIIKPLSDVEINKIKMLFIYYTNVFKNNNNFNRKNFLNYYFVINKLLIIINRTDFSDIIPKLLNKRKLKEHQLIWDKLNLNTDPRP